ncbi:2-amino-4-hydroxy-6-hydroxymethyldihydropteridine diphosphokinase [Paenibacillus sp. Z6-24]
MNSSVPSEYSEAYIALGANLGNREQTLTEAIQKLDDQSDISVIRCSGFYETVPVGYVDQPSFLNMALRLHTTKRPHDLLAALLSIENQLGRIRDIRWGPRTVDLDLLWMDHLHLHSETLDLPHPRMHERAFVLVPLQEIVTKETPELFSLVEKSLIQVADQQQDVRYVSACPLSFNSKLK